MEQQSIRIRNKKAFFNYEIIEKYVAGIQLYGTEVKSIRDSKLSFTDAYCLFINNELWLRGIHISEYAFGSYNNHVPKRDRKLLLNKKELLKIKKKTVEKSQCHDSCHFRRNGLQRTYSFKQPAACGQILEEAHYYRSACLWGCL